MILKYPTNLWKTTDYKLVKREFVFIFCFRLRTGQKLPLCTEIRSVISNFQFFYGWWIMCFVYQQKDTIFTKWDEIWNASLISRSRPLLQKLIAVDQVNNIIRVKVSYFDKRTKGVITQLHSSSEDKAKHTKV